MYTLKPNMSQSTKIPHCQGSNEFSWKHGEPQRWILAASSGFSPSKKTILMDFNNPQSGLGCHFLLCTLYIAFLGCALLWSDPVISLVNGVINMCKPSTGLDPCINIYMK